MDLTAVDLEVMYDKKYRNARRGGIVGHASGRAGFLVYPQPAVALFDKASKKKADQTQPEEGQARAEEGQVRAEEGQAQARAAEDPAAPEKDAVKHLLDEKDKAK